MFCPPVKTRRTLRHTVLNLCRNMARSNSESEANKFESLTAEYQICRRKLESKCEALLILSRELDQCRSERDQFKLMAEQLRDRYQMVKRQLTGDTPMSSPHVEVDPKTYSDIQTQSLARLLFDTKEANKSLKFEAEDLKQKLQDAEGDIKLLREQIVRSRVGTSDEGLTTRHFPAHEREDLVKQLEVSREELLREQIVRSRVGTSDEGLTTRHFPAHEREDLVKQLEVSREEFVQLERDLQQVLDEKEELVTERDAYRTKFERLNTELNYILGGDERRIVDIDALSMENKFLQEKLKQIEEEKTMAIATVSKYKQIMQSRSSITPTPQALADLQGLCGALLDTISDKNLALSHQRKTNKLLGNRVSELEKKLKTLEVSGLWSVSGNFQNLEKLKAEYEEIKTLVPRKFSHSTDTSEAPHDASDLDSDLSSVTNSLTTSPAHQKHTLHQLSRLDLEELDLLPTKEEVVKGEGHTDPSGNLGDGKTSSSHDMSSLGVDSAIGISDLENCATETVRSRIVLTEAMLKSLLGSSINDTGASGGDWVLSHSDEGEMDNEDRVAAIQRCLRQDSEDDEKETYSPYDFSCDDSDDEEEEMNEDFKRLLESVTQKLLQRSQQQDLVSENHDTEPHQEHKIAVKDRNVYIRDDFDDIAPVIADAICESDVLSTNHIPASLLPKSVICDVVNKEHSSHVNDNHKDISVTSNISNRYHHTQFNNECELNIACTTGIQLVSNLDMEEKGQGDRTDKNALPKMYTLSSDAEDKEERDKASDITLAASHSSSVRLSSSSSITEE